MTPSRIIVDARVLRGPPGGVAAYVQALVEHLPKLLPNVPIVFLRHPNNRYRLSQAPNITEWLSSGTPQSPRDYFRMGVWLNARLASDDLFHAPYRILPKGVLAKSVISIHDVMQLVCPELVFPNPVLRAVARPFWSIAVRSTIKRADRLLAVSQYSADDTLRVDPSCAPRLRVTLNGKSSSFRPIEKADAERATSFIVPIGKRFFLVIGGGYPNKNHVAAVSAFGKEFPDSENMHLLMIERRRTFPPEIRRIVRRHHLGGRVQVRGSVSTEQLVALYNRAEALVFPSLYEGFGIPVLEAMASGCPVLCSNVTSLPEVAGDAALQFNPNDHDEISTTMRRIVEDKNLRTDLSKRGLRRAALFDWRKTVLETIDVYREIAPWIPAPRVTAPRSRELR